MYALRADVRPLKAGELLLDSFEDLVRARQKRREVGGVLPVFVALHLTSVLVEQVGKVYRHCLKLLSGYFPALKPACVEEAVAVVVRAPQQAEQRVNREPRREQPQHQRVEPFQPSRTRDEQHQGDEYVPHYARGEYAYKQLRQ